MTSSAGPVSNASSSTKSPSGTERYRNSAICVRFQQFPRSANSLFAGKIAEAEALATNDMLPIPGHMPCYQILGDLHLDLSPSALPDETKIKDNRLELNLATAIATTKKHSPHARGVQFRQTRVIVGISSRRSISICRSAIFHPPHSRSMRFRICGVKSASAFFNVASPIHAATCWRAF